MKWWIKFGCFLTGWNSQILSYCSEASFKHLKKYTAALLILILLWGFTGYSFAYEYVEAPWWGCAICAMVFIIIVIQIERQIILTVGKSNWALGFRVFIAVIMSLIGSSIIDQIIFGKDIDRKMIEIVDEKAAEQSRIRTAQINEEQGRIQINMDSIGIINNRLNDEITEKPEIITYISTGTTVRDSTGKVMSTEKGVTAQTTPNPKIKQVAMNDTILQQLRDRYRLLSDKKMQVESELRKELSENAGFLEDLNAMIEILSERPIALIFYSIVFLFLMSLELFVVTSKFGDKKCDYDLIVEHQLQIKQQTLEELVKKMSS
ncbi:MAG: DUF4407 domain-containing protein [Mediterranea sp.]|jgi:hypothetical protein|nr:DUF4407 domain-containing protein [Mediterranea sp.]